MPHRYRGRSVYDEVGDIQRVKSVLLRQFMDNTYLVDNPMMAANGTAIENKDALINPKVGQIIWTNGPPGDAMVPVGIPYIGDKIFPSLEYFDMVIEKRTGVSRSTMAWISTPCSTRPPPRSMRSSPPPSPKWRPTPATSRMRRLQRDVQQDC